MGLAVVAARQERVACHPTPLRVLLQALLLSLIHQRAMVLSCRLSGELVDVDPNIPMLAGSCHRFVADLFSGIGGVAGHHAAQG